MSPGRLGAPEAAGTAPATSSRKVLSFSSTM